MLRTLREAQLYLENQELKRKLQTLELRAGMLHQKGHLACYEPEVIDRPRMQTIKLEMAAFADYNVSELGHHIIVRTTPPGNEQGLRYSYYVDHAAARLVDINGYAAELHERLLFEMVRANKL